MQYKPVRTAKCMLPFSQPRRPSSELTKAGWIGAKDGLKDRFKRVIGKGEKEETVASEA